MRGHLCLSDEDAKDGGDVYWGSLAGLSVCTRLRRCKVGFYKAIEVLDGLLSLRRRVVGCEVEMGLRQYRPKRIHEFGILRSQRWLHDEQDLGQRVAQECHGLHSEGAVHYLQTRR